jgi:hypothetical protein
VTSQEQVPYGRSADLAADQEFEPPVDSDIVIVAAEDSLTVDGLDDNAAGDELADDELADDELASVDADVAVVVAAREDVPAADAQHDNGDVGREWHDIQAMFVDDPRGSVVLAAAAAEAAVDALMATLHQRETALRPASTAGHDSPAGDSTETEQLREALRSYRMFCQQVTHLGQQLSEPATMTS